MGQHMEHRYETRASAGLDVEIWHGSRWLGRFRTSDVGRSGMFIATGPIGLGLHDSVHIALNGATPAQRIAGIVVHVGEEGIGVLCGGTVPVMALTPMQAVGF